MIRTSSQSLLPMVVVVFCGLQPAARGQEALSVVLQPQVQAAAALVRIADIAHLTGGSEVDRRRIGELDLTELPPGAAERRITRRQVLLRILLSGFPVDGLKVEGAQQTVVVREEETRAPSVDLPDVIRRHVVDLLAQQLGVAPDKLRVRYLHQPVLPEWPESLLAETRVQLRADSRLHLGRMHPQVVLVSGDRISAPVPLAFEALANQMLPVAAQPISRHQAMGPDNVQWVSRWVDQSGLPLAPEQLSGKVAARTIAAGQVIGPQMVKEVQVESKEDYLVDPRRPVRLVARRGGLTVYLHSAETLQRGRQGDYVRVRNPSSHKPLTGMVIGADEVEIVF
jgi:flagella basal body P-ring formation protein FlgA